MQILKEEIRCKILTNAENLFYQKGFKETTTRQIAAKTGISVSNLYKYFKNKEDIFNQIVQGYHQKILQELTELFSIKHKNHDNMVVQQVTDNLLDLIMNNRKKFIILMHKSNSTPYAGFKDKIISMFAAHMKKEINPQKLPNMFILEIIAKNFFDGFIHILEAEKKSASFFQQNITSLMKFHLKGMSQFK